MLIKYQIRNNFISSTATTAVTTGTTINGAYKSILLPIGNNFLPVDYGDDVNKFVINEVRKSINPYFDGETTKYIYSDKDLTISFRFWDEANSSLVQDYSAAGFTRNDILLKKNGFRKSFFRLYFYDSIDTENSQLLFTEDLDVGETTTPTFNFNELYWLRNDKFFIENNSSRVVYMEANFFNAKIGKILTLINIPDQYQQINMADYTSNPSWRRVPFLIKNPKLNFGYYNFIPNSGSNTIVLSQLVID